MLLSIECFPYGNTTFLHIYIYVHWFLWTCYHLVVINTLFRLPQIFGGVGKIIIHSNL